MKIKKPKGKIGTMLKKKKWFKTLRQLTSNDGYNAHEVNLWNRYARLYQPQNTLTPLEFFSDFNELLDWRIADSAYSGVLIYTGLEIHDLKVERNEAFPVTQNSVLL
ncbi:hypothetical protein ES708_20826 [subsurface metagenome]